MRGFGTRLLSAWRRIDRRLPLPVRGFLWRWANVGEGLDEFDRRDNAAGRLPEGEALAVPAMWIADCYPPTATPGLLETIKKLGLERHQFAPDRDPARWLTDARAREGGAWGDIAVIAPPGSSEGIGSSPVRMRLPRGVRRVGISLEVVTGSLAVAVYRVEFTDRVSETLTRLLNTPYRRYPRYRDGRFYVITPASEREERVKGYLDSLRDAIVKWLSRAVGFHGAFSSGDVALPCIYMMTLAAARPLTEEVRQTGWGGWGFNLGMEQAHEAWEAGHGLRLRLPETSLEPPGLLAGRSDEIFRDAVQDMYGGSHPRAWANRVADSMRALLSLLASYRLLILYSDEVARIRDDVRHAEAQRRRSATAALKRLADSVARMAQDIAPIATDLSVAAQRGQLIPEAPKYPHGPRHYVSRIIDARVQSSRKRSRLWRHLPEPLYRQSPAGRAALDTARARVKDELFLDDALRAAIGRVAGRLRETEGRTREAMSTIAALLSSVESVRLDRTLFWLTIVVLALGVVEAVGAIPTVISLLRDLGSF